MNQEKILQDLRNSIAVMRSNINLFENGTKEVYIVIANELRKLICDKENSLLPKIFSSITLFPIKYPDKKTGPNLILQTFGSMKFNGKGDYKIINLFDESKTKIDLPSWLKQTLMISHGEITIEQLIKSIADKEGAHADDNYNKTIHQIKFMKVGKQDTRGYYVAAIGEYILNEIDKNIHLIPSAS